MTVDDELRDTIRHLADIEAIRNVKATYAYYADGGFEGNIADVEVWSAIFTEDAVWDGGPVIGSFTGLAALRKVERISATGAVVAATIGGWSCAAPGPAQFDGTYEIDRLPIGESYTVYAEALNGVVSPAQIVPATAGLCRNSTTDPGWPPQQACTVPPLDVSFTTRTLPGP